MVGPNDRYEDRAERLASEYERLKALENDDTNRRVSAVICAMGVSEFCAMGVVEALTPEFDALAADAAMWREIALALRPGDSNGKPQVVCEKYGDVYEAWTRGRRHEDKICRGPTPEAALLAWWNQRNRKAGE